MFDTKEYKEQTAVSILRKDHSEYPKDGANRIRIPFGDEYCIKIVNNNPDNKRLKADVFIDGESVGNGHKFIVLPTKTLTQSLYLERFFEGDLETGRKFQWLPLDSKEVKHKKGRPETGIVEVRLYFEKTEYLANLINMYNACDNYWTGSTQGEPTVYRSACATNTSSYEPSGATGKGGVSGQRFEYASDFEVEPEPVIYRFYLVPEVEKETEKVVAVKDIYCTRCGTKRRKSSDNYCYNCGNKF